MTNMGKRIIFRSSIVKSIFFSIAILAIIFIIYGITANAESDPERFECLKTIGGYSGIIAYSENNQWLASDISDNTIKILDTSDWSEIKTLSGHSQMIKSVAFSENNQWFASGSGDDTIKIWDTSDWSELQTLTGHSQSIESVAFSENNQWLASGSRDDTIKIWNTSDWTEIKTLTGHSLPVMCVDFSENNVWIVSGSMDDTIKIWNTSDWSEIKTLTGHYDNVWSVSFSQNNKWLASSSGDDTIIIWDTADWSEIKTLIGHSDLVYSVDFSENNEWLASGSYEEIKIWDTADWTEIKKLTGHSAQVWGLDFSENNKWLASSSGHFGSGEIKIWNTSEWSEVKTLTGHSVHVGSIVFSKNNKWLASGSDDQTIKIWNTSDWSEMKTLNEHSSNVNSVDFSENNKWLASGSDDQTIKIWNTSDWSEIKTLNGHSDYVESVDFSENNEWLASGSRDNSIKIWNTSDWSEIKTLSGHSSYVYSLTFSQDNKWLASSSDDITIKIWTGSEKKDWIVTGTEIRENEEIILTGNLTIKDGGILTFKNVTLKMNCLEDGEFHIEVQEGGKFYILDNDNNNETTYDASNITAVNPDYNYYFQVKENAILEMKNSELHECGYYESGYEGLLIESNDVIIEYNLISNNLYGLYLYYHNVSITHNIFKNNYFAILCFFSNSTITDNFFFNNERAIQCSYSTPILKNNFIRDNNLHGIFCSFSNPIISNSTIINSGHYDIYLRRESFPTVINSYFEIVEFYDDISNLTEKWYLDVKVTDTDKTPLGNININIKDNENGTFDKNYKTKADGGVKWIECTEYIQDSSGKIFLTPHNIKVSKGKDTNETSLNIDENKIIEIVLEDNIAPEISNIEPKQVTINSVKIDWTTNEPCDSLVKYGEDESYGFEEYSENLVTSHSIELTGLDAGTIYHFCVESSDENDNSNQSKDYSYTTKEDTGDIEPPENPTFSPANGEKVNTKTPAITITFSEEVIITEAKLNGLNIKEDLETEDDIIFSYTPVSNLTEVENTISVKAKDFSDNEMSDSIVCTFTIEITEVDETPPEITETEAIDITQNSVTITWKTNEPSTSQVEYGKADTYGQLSDIDNNFTTIHNITITGLEIGTTYHYRAISEDEHGNENISEDYTFKTLEKTEEPDINLKLEIIPTEIKKGDEVTIKETITNKGTATIEIKVIFMVDVIKIDEKKITIESGKSGSSSITWKAVKGNHTIKVVVKQNDKDVTNGTVSKNIEVKKAGDDSAFNIIYLIPIIIIPIVIGIGLFLRNRGGDQTIQTIQQPQMQQPIPQTTWQQKPQTPVVQPTTQPTQPITQQTTQPGIQICPYCNVQVPGEFRFCNMCGKQIKE